jgi:hypothetical protein
MIFWESYDLPSFSRGVNRRRANPFYSEQPLVGEQFIFSNASNDNDLPGVWDVLITCNAFQMSELMRLYEDVQNETERVFSKDVVTEVGVRVQTYSFLNGIPQPIQIAEGVYQFSFALYSEFVDLSIGNYDVNACGEFANITAITGTPKWDDFKLPGFTRGYSSSQADPIARDKALNGPLFEQVITSDLPVIWEVSLICVGAEADNFSSFLRRVSGVSAGYFIKEMETSKGRFEQYLRISSGIPQGLQIADNVWSYQFTMVSPYLNSVAGALPNIDSNPYNTGTGIAPRIPLYWSPLSRGLANKSNTTVFNAISTSGNTEVTIAGGVGGALSVSFDAGVSWNNIVNPAGEVNINDIKVSRTGNVIIAVMDNGLILVSRNAARTFKVMTGINSLVLPGEKALCCSISNNGDKMFVGFENGNSSVSFDAGETWSNLPVDLGLTLNPVGNDILSVVMDGAGGVIFASIDGGLAAISYNSGVSFVLISDITTQMGGNNILSVAASEAGNVLYYAGKIGLCGISINSGVNFTALERHIGWPSIVPFDINTVSCSENGATVFFGGSIGQATYSIDNGTTLITKAQGNQSGVIEAPIRSSCANDNDWFCVVGDGFGSSSRGITPE